MASKLVKLLKNPLHILRSRVSYFIDWIMFKKGSEYEVEQYWAHRHSKYGFDLRGVGHGGFSHQDNLEDYQKAKETFLALCEEHKIDFQSVKMLDVGCGTGFYAGVFSEAGGKEYLGADVTDALFEKLRKQFPNFQFQKLDICTEELKGEFDLIIMIDVTQHITNDDKFSFAMQNIKSHLAEDGVFIVTSWVRESGRDIFYERSRPLEAYQKEFSGYVFSQPLPFRDKFIFSIRR